jgi:ribosomal protein S13
MQTYGLDLSIAFAYSACSEIRDTIEDKHMFRGDVRRKRKIKNAGREKCHALVMSMQGASVRGNVAQAAANVDGY